MVKILNIAPRGRGGLENISSLLSRKLKDFFELKDIAPSENPFFIWKCIKDSDITIIHRGFIFRKVFPAIFLFKPKVIFAHHFGARRKKTDLYHKMLYSKISAICVISQKIANEIRRKWSVDPEKVRVLYYGIEIDKFFRTDRRKVRERYGIDDREFVLGVVGRIGYEKNQKLLLEALRISGINATCFLVGPIEDEKYFQGIKELSQKVKKTIIIPEFVENMVDIYNAFDFLVITSREEPFGIVGLEAMACGVPVIAPDNSGISEIISDGVNSFLYRNNDPYHLAEVIKKVYRIDTKDISLNARRQIEENFTADAYSERWRKLISEILEKR